MDVLINNCDIDPRNGREVHALTHDGYAPFMRACQTDQKPMDRSADDSVYMTCARRNEKLFSLKCLSHFMVTYLLLDLLKLSAPSRVINVCPRPSTCSSCRPTITTHTQSRLGSDLPVLGVIVWSRQARPHQL